MNERMAAAGLLARPGDEPAVARDGEGAARGEPDHREGEGRSACGVCGTTENIVDGHMIETPTGEICIDCWIDVTDGPAEPHQAAA